MMKKEKEMNKNIGSKSLHHFVLRLLVSFVRHQVAKPQVLMRSQQNCSKQKERQYWTECTEYVWWSGKLMRGQRNERSPRSSHFPSKVIFNSVQITEQLLLSHMQARSFFRSYRKRSQWKPKQRMRTNRRNSRKGTRDQVTNLRILMQKAREHQQPHYVLCGLQEGSRLDLPW